MKGEKKIGILATDDELVYMSFTFFFLLYFQTYSNWHYPRSLNKSPTVWLLYASIREKKSWRQSEKIMVLFRTRE